MKQNEPLRSGSDHPAAMPSPQQMAWQDLELGMFLHFGPATWQGHEFDDLSTPLERLNPSRLDTEQWVDAAVAMGARYILMVAKHMGGFCWWPTSTTDYSVASIPWRKGKGDVMSDLRKSCDRRGIRLGVYLSPCDAKHGAGVGGRCSNPAAQAAYDQVFRQQLTELLDRYGPMVEVWFDGSSITPADDILDRYAGQAVVFQGPRATIRWNGNEEGITPYPSWPTVWKNDRNTGIATALHSNPDGDTWLPIECDFPIRNHFWFWKPNAEATVRSLEELVQIYYGSVGRGAQMVMNLTPDTTGLISQPDFDRAVEFGREIRRRFGYSVAETKGTGEVVELRLDAPQKVDHVVLMEDTAGGARVREYAVEGTINGEWRPLCRGSMIGHKRIDMFEATEVSAIRLRCPRATATPIIRRLAAYHTGDATLVCVPVHPEVWAAEHVGAWSPETVGTAWTRIDFPISPYACRVAGQYRLWLQEEAGCPALEVNSVVLLCDDKETPGHITRAPEPGSFIVNVTGVASKMGLRLEMRASADSPTRGLIFLRKLDWPELSTCRTGSAEAWHQV